MGLFAGRLFGRLSLSFRRSPYKFGHSDLVVNVSPLSAATVPLCPVLHLGCLNRLPLHIRRDIRAAAFERVHGEFALMQPLVFGINRDSVCANDRI
jgi:hypothetical protein